MNIINASQSINDLKTLFNSYEDHPSYQEACYERALVLAAAQNIHHLQFPFPPTYLDLFEDEEEVYLTPEEYHHQGGAAEPIPDPNPTPPFEQHCQVEQEFDQYVKQWKVHGKAYNVKFKDLAQVDDISELINTLFQDILKKTAVEEGQLIGFEIRHPQLDSPIIIPFHKKEEHTAEKITRTIEAVIQSHEELNLNDGMTVQVTTVDKVQGSGRMKRPINHDEFMQHHRSIIEIPGEDNLCMPRALVTSIAHVDNDPQWKSIREGTGTEKKKYKMQEKRARALMEQAGLQQHQGPWTLDELQRFQDTLTPQYQIRVFTQANCGDMCYQGPKAPKILYLFLHEEHYSVITKIGAFLNTSYYCIDCNQSYSHHEDHRVCKVTCTRCLGPQKCEETNMIQCQECQRWFANPQCYDRHKSEQTNGIKRGTKAATCTLLKRCSKCKVEHKTRLKHECDMGYCTFCKTQVPRMKEHQCYMAPFDDKDKEAAGFIFFDFETQQVKQTGENKYGAIYLHEPICCVVHKVCDTCWKQEDMNVHCNNCKTRKRIFIGENLLDDFTKWLFSKENRGYIAMAHNNRGYDGQFIWESLQRTTVEPPEIIFKGLEIMKLQLGGVRVLDSLNFLPMPLSAMPAAFNLTELKKGYFPHYFSSVDQWNYEGPYPDAFFYGPAQMKLAAKNKFFQWYLNQKDKVFKFKEELLAYCNSDVDILKKGAMTFRDTFKKETGLDPYVHSITISDACSKVFRMKFLQDNTIGLIPSGEYRAKDKFSHIGIKWLRWVMQQQGISIKHALNGGEVTVAVSGHQYKVDGLHEKTVYEFHGCTFHGCLKCFKPSTLLPLTGKLAKEANQETSDRKKQIESLGYRVVEMWECTLKQQCRANPVMQQFFNDQNIMEPLKARDGYYGGRTNCTKLYHKAAEGETIEYIDICSLYPFVLKYGIFPIGHPTIVTENFKDLSGKPYQGMIKCRMLSPRRMYHPVLPVRVHGKLMFPCCMLCAQLRQRDTCNHKQDERAYWGTWVTLEVYKAIERGYTVLEIAEVWDYGDNVMQYQQGADEKSGLFTEYINTFLKLKQEASDWPANCKSDEEKMAYLENYLEHEGIQLNEENIKKNKALRALSKLCLNSFYGKFGQRNNMPKAKCLTEPSEFFEILTDATKQIKMIRAMNDKMLQINYVHEEGFEDALPSTNVVIAAYVTAQARLKLYTYLEELQQAVLYFDTDSIVYVHRQGEVKIPVGSYLGDMTNELEDYGEGAYIKEFVSAGPKNYAYQVQCPNGKLETTVKIRGFTLDSITGKRLNMRTLKNKVHAFVRTGYSDKTTVISCKIEREKGGFVYTKPKRKTYSLIVDKRWCAQNFMTYPFGY